MERLNESEREYREGDWGVKYLFRGPRIEWGVIRLKPGQSLPGHYHEQVEETFYILEGAATLNVNGRPHQFASGDAVRLQPMERHSILNESDRPVKIVFIKCPYLSLDKVTCA